MPPKDVAFFRGNQRLLEKHFGIGVWPICINLRHDWLSSECRRETAVAYLTLPLSSHAQSQAVRRWIEVITLDIWIQDMPGHGFAMPVSTAAATENQFRTFLRMMRLLGLKQLARPHGAAALDVRSYAHALDKWRAITEATLSEAESRPYLTFLCDTGWQNPSGSLTDQFGRTRLEEVVELQFRL